MQGDIVNNLKSYVIIILFLILFSMESKSPALAQNDPLQIVEIPSSFILWDPGPGLWEWAGPLSQLLMTQLLHHGTRAD